MQLRCNQSWLKLEMYNKSLNKKNIQKKQKSLKTLKMLHSTSLSHHDKSKIIYFLFGNVPLYYTIYSYIIIYISTCSEKSIQIYFFMGKNNDPLAKIYM